ncbi:hypothetical protein P7K49_024947, partial [Saguinus oedipus]
AQVVLAIMDFQEKRDPFSWIRIQDHLERSIENYPLDSMRRRKGMLGTSRSLPGLEESLRAHTSEEGSWLHRPSAALKEAE